MRLLLALLGLVLLTAAAPTRDWSAATTRTPAGAYLLGNPAAPLKLVEYGSYTCSHCAEFAVTSEAVLKGRMIRSGKVSLEYRHLLRDRMDLGAAILARCFGTRGFARASAAIFATQQTWLPQIAAWAPAHPEVAQLGELAQARAYADASGLTELMKRRGLAPARIDACFANRAEVDVVTAMTAAAPADVQYTPSIFLNGEFQANMTWDRLEPILRARGAQ